ncbi:MAG: 4-hydroxy-3-methylbut-2-enyl diphosphate reductase, partial [Clostridia bacterium]|nr:4-hydroxy-3-methylbut-2-enyl diphosphate reductase [Clostridia bacterium]
MQLAVAENIGFCFGVERAIEIARAECEKHGRVYTYGELIHNSDVIDGLREEGIIPADTLEEIPCGSTVIIRSHGVGPNELAQCGRRGLKAVDATCPFVKRIHEIVRRHSEMGYSIVVFGTAGHPEVKGIEGWSGSARIVANPAQAAELEYADKVCLVSQTTANAEEFIKTEAVLRDRCGELCTFNTICKTTGLRQQEAEELSKICTRMIVVGGHHSANTQKLCAICKKYCKNVDSIAKVDELTLENIDINDIIGFVGGASTPKWIILEVIKRMSELEKTMAASPVEENVEAVAAAAVQESVAENAEPAE